MAETKLTTTTHKDADNFISLRDCLNWFADRWSWFVISMVIAMLIAVLYIMSKEPVYLRTAKLLLKETSDGKSAVSDVGSFSDLGLFQENTNVNQ